MPVERNEAKHRFELSDNGHTAFLNYAERANALHLVHTEVPDALGGRGIGGQLAKAALDAARSRGMRVAIECPFIASYVQRHPEYNDLIESV